MTRYGTAVGWILSLLMAAFGLWTLLGGGDQGVGLSLIVIAIACWPVLGRTATRRRC